ncbi:hypothetical protein HZ326_24956 [Fusarium oxysporum f. sp. albedinis]|nr:hypothetical protein HZ326_24956 [Fusarium oxysporum f. sp. albedinis]
MKVLRSKFRAQYKLRTNFRAEGIQDRSTNDFGAQWSLKLSLYTIGKLLQTKVEESGLRLDSGEVRREGFITSYKFASRDGICMFEICDSSVDMKKLQLPSARCLNCRPTRLDLAYTRLLGGWGVKNDQRGFIQSVGCTPSRLSDLTNGSQSCSA